MKPDPMEVKVIVHVACMKRGISVKELGIYACGSETTIHRRLDDPGSFRMDELARICKRTHMSKEDRADLFEAIIGVVP